MYILFYMYAVNVYVKMAVVNIIYNHCWACEVMLLCTESILLLH